MASAISVALGVDGAKQFKESMQQSNAAIKELASELKLTSAEFGDAAKSQEALVEQNDILERTISTLNEKLAAQEEALQSIGSKFGEASVETIKMKEEVNKTKTAIAEASNQMEANTAAIESMGDAEEDAGKKTSTFGEVLKANLTSEAIINGVKKLAGALKDVSIGAAQAADEVASLAVKTGLTTDQVQEFKYMEDLVDVDLNTLTGSMSKLIKQMSSAKEGTGTAADAFSTLGISVTDANGELRSNKDVWYEVIAALGKVSNETERDALAMDLFGKSAQDLNPIIAAGTEALQSLAQEAHDTGYVLGEEQISNLTAASDAYARTQKSVEALKNQVGAQLAPALESVLKAVSGLIQNFDKLAPVLVAVTAAIGAYALALGITSAIKAVQTATESMTLAQAALNAVMNANPIGLIIGLLAGLVAGLVTAYNTNEEFRAKVDAAWQSLKDGVKNAADKIKGVIDNVIEWFKGIPQQALEWGRDLLENFVSGIKEKIQKVKDVVSGVAQTVKDFLGFSEPDKGPLSNFHTYAPDMMKLYSKGIRENAYMVEDALDDSLAVPMPQMTAGQAAAGIVNGISTAVGGRDNSITVNLVLPDGTEFASYYLDSFIETARSNGTPILNPA